MSKKLYTTKSETERGVEHYVLCNGEKRLFSISSPFYKGTKRNFDALATHLNKQAARLAELEAENARLREALEPFARMGSLVEHAIEIPALTYGEHEATYEDLKRAADALRGEPG